MVLSNIAPFHSIRYLGFKLKNNKNMFDPFYDINDLKITRNVICSDFKMVDTYGKTKLFNS